MNNIARTVAYINSRRLREALRFNEPQISANVLMSLLIFGAWVGSERTVWVLLLALAVAPTISFVANLINPLK